MIGTQQALRVSMCVCSLNREAIGWMEAFRVPTMEGEGFRIGEVALHMQSMSELTCVVGLPLKNLQLCQLEAHHWP